MNEHIQDAEYEVIEDAVDETIAEKQRVDEQTITEYNKAMQLITSFVFFAHKDSGQDVKKLIRNTLEKEILMLIKINKEKLEAFYDAYHADTMEEFCDNAGSEVQESTSSSETV